MFKLKLAIKYFLRRPVAWLATIAVAVSVFIVLVVMTVMNGLVRDYTEKNHRLVGDCVIASDSLVGFPHYNEFMELLKTDENIFEVSPVVNNFCLMSMPGQSWSIGVNLTGIDPVRHSKVTGFGQSLYVEQKDSSQIFKSEYAAGQPGCVRGIAIMNERDHQGNYTHRLDYPIKLVMTCFPLSYKGTLLKAGTDVVNTKAFYVANDSEQGVAKVDGKTVYVPIEYAQQLCGLDVSEPRVNAIYVKLKDESKLKQSVLRIEEQWESFIKQYEGTRYYSLLQNVKVQDWRTFRRDAIAPMEKEQVMLTVLFLMLALVTVFIIFVVFFMIVNHKRKDIGIFKSFGISAVGLLKVFLAFSFIIGIVGSLAGTLAGVAFLSKINNLEDWLFDKFGFQLWDRTMYNIGDIPNDFSSDVVMIIILAAVCACLIGALMPVLGAVKQKPAEILQVDQL